MGFNSVFKGLIFLKIENHGVEVREVVIRMYLKHTLCLNVDLGKSI